MIHTIIILFLAHNGVANSKLWMKWRERLNRPNCNIIFIVHSPFNVEYGQDFCLENHIGLDFGTTSCGDYSIVFETHKAFRKISELYSDINFNLHFLSGNCFPIISPNTIFAYITKTIYNNNLQFFSITKKIY